MRTILMLLMLGLYACTLETVASGEAGIAVDDSGLALLDSGDHYIPFHKTFVKMDISKQSLSEDITCLTKDTMDAKIVAVIEFQPRSDELLDLYRMFTEQYQDRLVIPELRESIRKEVRLVRRDSLREQIVKDVVFSCLDTVLRKEHVELIDLKIKFLDN